MGHHTQDEMLLCSNELLVVHCPCHPERSSGTLRIGAFVQRKLARLCGALPWTTTVSLRSPRCNSSIRKEERLDRKLDGLMMVVGRIAGVICDFAGGVGTCSLRSEIGSGADYQRNCQNTASRTTTRAIIKLISAHKLAFRLSPLSSICMVMTSIERPAPHA